MMFVSTCAHNNTIMPLPGESGPAHCMAGRKPKVGPRMQAAECRKLEMLAEVMAADEPGPHVPPGKSSYVVVL